MQSDLKNLKKSVAHFEKKIEQSEKQAGKKLQKYADYTKNTKKELEAKITDSNSVAQNAFTSRFEPTIKSNSDRIQNIEDSLYQRPNKVRSDAELREMVQEIWSSVYTNTAKIDSLIKNFDTSKSSIKSVESSFKDHSYRTTKILKEVEAKLPEFQMQTKTLQDDVVKLLTDFSNFQRQLEDMKMAINLETQRGKTADQDLREMKKTMDQFKVDLTAFVQNTHENSMKEREKRKKLEKEIESQNRFFDKQFTELNIKYDELHRSVEACDTRSRSALESTQNNLAKVEPSKKPDNAERPGSTGLEDHKIIKELLTRVSILEKAENTKVTEAQIKEVVGEVCSKVIESHVAKETEQLNVVVNDSVRKQLEDIISEVVERVEDQLIPPIKNQLGKLDRRIEYIDPLLEVLQSVSCKVIEKLKKKSSCKSKKGNQEWDVLKDGVIEVFHILSDSDKPPEISYLERKRPTAHFNSDSEYEDLESAAFDDDTDFFQNDDEDESVASPNISASTWPSFRHATHEPSQVHQNLNRNSESTRTTHDEHSNSPVKRSSNFVGKPNAQNSMKNPRILDRGPGKANNGPLTRNIRENHNKNYRSTRALSDETNGTDDSRLTSDMDSTIDAITTYSSTGQPQNKKESESAISDPALLGSTHLKFQRLPECPENDNNNHGTFSNNNLNAGNDRYDPAVTKQPGQYGFSQTERNHHDQYGYCSNEKNHSGLSQPNLEYSLTSEYNSDNEIHASADKRNPQFATFPCKQHQNSNFAAFYNQSSSQYPLEDSSSRHSEPEHGTITRNINYGTEESWEDEEDTNM